MTAHAPLRGLLVGAGQRGFYAFGPYARSHPDELVWSAVVEPDDERRRRFADTFGVPRERCFSAAEDAFARADLADVAVIATPDARHHDDGMRALAAGYPVLLEKPLASTIEACRDLVEAARRAGQGLHVAHVLRYAPFFEKLHEVVASGVLGELVSVEHRENVAFWHMAHSYVRGSWRRERESAPMLLAKCCHDLDILCWNLPSPVARVSSFGSLKELRPERAPSGAAARCVDCLVEECVYDARRIYLDEEVRWPATVVSTDTSLEARRRAIATGPYGRCVYRCDNDVVDTQSVHMELEDGCLATLIMHGHAAEESRTLRYDGTKATLRGRFQHDGVLEITTRRGAREVVEVPAGDGGHGGGDTGVVRAFLRAVREGSPSLSTAAEALRSHELGFAAEESRRSGRVVDMAAYRARAAARQPDLAHR